MDEQMINKIILSGIIDKEEGHGIIINGINLGEYIANKLTDIEFPDYDGDYHRKAIGGDGIFKHFSSPLAFVQIYLNEKEFTPDEAINYHILSSMGEIDVQVDWIGYSELTISYFSTENLIIGGHNIENMLAQYIGKYVLISVEIKEMI
ncbi:hypothetical protein SAMN04487895_101599 [Paenibacillus sophorae]|uniref:Uncharacterized protein n=1 Tax=Paenibacillus sophorae TaxID=1333845 RepID=A0A1H8GQG7_9BACL|nr:hypothetical protein [Paenibacillus sophorae]QWU14299.1 hypothetical protein KP014_20545 [Paenibacillus sophorae]SEN45974.1 hypothetical protein SAMN04487895_101599 [Paenibacillus sophorae]